MMGVRLVGWAVVVGLAAVAGRAEQTVFEEDFAGYPAGAELSAPWESSAEHTGIIVRVESPPGASAGESWLRLADPVAAPSRANANIRREIPALEYGTLTFRLHVGSLARFAVYLGTGSASAPEDRLVGFKVHQDGRHFLINDRPDHRPAWALRTGATYLVTLAFAPHEKTHRNVSLTFDDGRDPRTFTAVVPRGQPVTAVRFTTENLDAGGDFYLTDLVLTRADG
jgi:hypothetical protein